MLLVLLLSFPIFHVLVLGKRCFNVTVPGHINARQGVFDVPPIIGNIDATTFAMNLTDAGRNFTQDALIGYQTVKEKYEISARFCQPDQPRASNSTVQLLIHGIVSGAFVWG